MPTLDPVRKVLRNKRKLGVPRLPAPALPLQSAIVPPALGHGPKGGGLYRNVEIGLNRRYKPVLAGDFFCEPVLALLARTSSGPANDLSSCPARTPTSQLHPVPALLTSEFLPARTRLVDFVLSVCLSSPGDGCAPLVGHLFGAALCSSTYYDGNHQRHCELAPA